ncbi:hypothetical protein D1Y84_09515 [Acidipila sp. EB88]|nr:hypothetical protein D1Y84_09515 [Acidipila sp. EB88]
MRKLTACFALTVLCALGVVRAASAQQPRADTVLLHGKIFTGAASQPYVEALAIRGDRIVASGDAHAIAAWVGPHTTTIDLHGRTVIPGINDAHHHFQLGPPEVDVDLGTVEPTWAQVQAGITAAVAKNPHGSLIAATIGFKTFADPSIDRAALDKLAPNTPVELETFTGHAMILNSAALRFYRVAENVANPFGGRFERDSKGRLNGTVREYALLNIERAAADRVPQTPPSHSSVSSSTTRRSTASPPSRSCPTRWHRHAPWPCSAACPPPCASASCACPAPLPPGATLPKAMASPCTPRRCLLSPAPSGLPMALASKERSRPEAPGRSRRTRRSTPS